jgi:hypothetical protein
VKIVHDEEVVKQWLDDQSWKTEYIAINLPEEARLDSREAVREHFRQHHLSNLISGVSDVALKASVFNKKTPPRMQNLVRYAIDDQKRFPLKIVNMLSQEFSSHGLQFFKRKKSVTHVSVSRPHHLNLEQTPVSDSIRNIVTFVVDNQNCTRRMILDKFAPEPDKPESAEAPAEAPAEGDAPKPDTPLSPERTAILSDLHWLVHQGHVIEYANGQMEIAPKPQPPQQKKKKPKPDKKPKAKKPETGGASSTSSQTPADAPAAESAPAAEETKPTETPEPSAEPAAAEAPADTPGAEEAKPTETPEPSAEPAAAEAPADTPAAEEAKPTETPEPSADSPATEASDTTESPEPSQALGQGTEPTEAKSAPDESPAPDDTSAGEAPAKVAE